MFPHPNAVRLPFSAINKRSPNNASTDVSAHCFVLQVDLLKTDQHEHGLRQTSTSCHRILLSPAQTAALRGLAPDIIAIGLSLTGAVYPALAIPPCAKAKAIPPYRFIAFQQPWFISDTSDLFRFRLSPVIDFRGSGVISRVPGFNLNYASFDGKLALQLERSAAKLTNIKW